MCMITYLPPHVPVPEQAIRNGAAWNDDGHGWAIAADIGMMIRSRFMDSDMAILSFMAAREAYPHAPALFHSRFATHGLVNTDNVHPFYVAGKDVVVAHNGILPAAFHPGKKDLRSDTRIMADEWLASQSSKGLWTRKERRRIGHLIGPGNKLAILSVSPILSRPKGYLINADRGEMRFGAWFSNGDYKYEWRRGRYSNAGYSSIGITRATSMFSDPGVDECAFCFSLGQVNHDTRLCEACRTCQDCYEYASDCMCWCPSKRDSEEVETLPGILHGKEVERWQGWQS